MGKYTNIDTNVCEDDCDFTDYMFDIATHTLCVRCIYENWVNDHGLCIPGPDCSIIGEDPDTSDDNKCKDW